VTTGEALAAGTAYLERKGIETPRLETELILAHTSGSHGSSSTPPTTGR